MNRGYYSSSLLAFVTLIASAMIVVVAFAVFVLRAQAVAQADDKLSQAQALGQISLSRQDADLSLDALAIARDPMLRSVLRSTHPTDLSAYLTAQSTRSNATEFLVLDDNGSVRARSGRQSFEAFDASLIGADEAVFIRNEDRLYRFAFAPLQFDSGMVWVAAGQIFGPGFAESIKRVSGVDVQFATSGMEPVVVAGSAASDGVGRVFRHRATLVSRGDVTVDAEFTLAKSVALRGYVDLALKLAALAFALAAVAVFAASLLLGQIASRAISKPLAQINAGILRITQGNYGDRIDVTGVDSVGRLAGAVNAMQTEIAERESRIVHHAEYDALTGLTNRAVVSDRLRAAIGRAQRRGANIAAMLVDIQRFGDVNGTHGNEVGDAVLKEVARRLASNTRATDLLARVGGDEFLIVVDDMEDHLATHISAFLADTLQKPIIANGRTINLSVRIGVAVYPGHCDTPEGLRRLANVALSTAKETNQRVVMYEPGQDERHLRELAILNDLPQALKSGQLYLQYQPKIDIKTRTVETVEALVRWQHPQLGFVRPDEFIGLLEQHNKIGVLTDWVLKTAVKQVRNWASRGFELSIAVNLSANDLLDVGLADRISALLSHYIVEPARLVVEVTESAVMQDPDLARQVLESLRAIGLKIAIDDFGTGQTSLSLLKQLPLNELKIDKSFVQELRADSGDAIIVKSTIDLGHNMGLHVVAEGVEGTYAWNLLKSYGCDLVQGYLISKPLSSDQLETWYLRMQARQASRLDFSFIEKATEKLTRAEPENISDVIGA